MYAKNLGTLAPTSKLIKFYASLLTKFNMAAVGHFGKVFFLFLTPILLMILVHKTHFLFYFHPLGLFSCLHTYKSNMAPVGHIDKVIIFDPYTIFTCNTSIVTTFGM